MAVLLLLFSPAGYSQPAQILIFSEGSAPVYETVVSQFKSRMKKPCEDEAPVCKPPYDIRYIDSAEQLSSAGDADLIITLGLRAAEIIGDISKPVVHALIPKSSHLPRHANHTTIFLDQPIARQLQLANFIRPDPHVGLLLGPSSQLAGVELANLAKVLDIPVSSRDVSEEALVGPLLQDILEQSNVLLALPDPMIFNRRTIFNILLSSYHNKIPVIGFSSAYVKAGALISVYSSPTDIAHHIAEFTHDHFTFGTGYMPKSLFPKYFSIAINHSVARSLGISLPDEDEIVRQILEQSDS